MTGVFASAEERRSSLRHLLAAQAVSTAGRGVFMATSAIYFTQLVGLDVQAVGVALSAAGGGGVVASYVFGRIGDVVSPRLLTVVALLGEAAALVALTWTTSLEGFAACAAGAAVMNRGGFTARNTLVARVFVGPDRTRIRAQMRVAVNLGIGVGSACAALVLGSGDGRAFRWAMTSAAAAYIVGALLTGRVSDAGAAPGSPAPVSGPRARSPWRDRRFVALTLVNAATATQFAISEVGLPIWTVQHTAAPRALVSVLLIVNTAVIVLFQVRLSVGLEHLPKAARAYAVSAGLMVVAMLGYAWARGLPSSGAVAVLILSVVSHSVAEVLMVGAAFSAAFELADVRSQGAYQGLYGVGQSTGLLVGPALVTWALTLGWDGWACLGLLYAVACFAGWALLAQGATRRAAAPKRRGTRRR